MPDPENLLIIAPLCMTPRHCCAIAWHTLGCPVSTSPNGLHAEQCVVHAWAPAAAYRPISSSAPSTQCAHPSMCTVHNLSSCIPTALFPASNPQWTSVPDKAAQGGLPAMSQGGYRSLSCCPGRAWLPVSWTVGCNLEQARRSYQQRAVHRHMRGLPQVGLQTQHTTAITSSTEPRSCQSSLPCSCSVCSSPPSLGMPSGHPALEQRRGQLGYNELVHLDVVLQAITRASKC